MRLLTISRKMAQVENVVSDASECETEATAGDQNGMDNRNGGGNGGVIGPSSFVFGENMESRVLKRPAEEQLDRLTSEQDDDQSASKKEEPGEFPKASQNVLSQRPIMFAGSSRENKPEKEESKSGFKLNPPTLVHGKAKSAPKTTDGEGDAASPAKPLLRPSPFCHTSPHWATLAAVATGGAFKSKVSLHPFSLSRSQWNGKDNKPRNPEDGSVEVSSSSPSTETTATPPKEDRGAEASAANGKPKPTYFIKLSSNETSRDTGFGTFGNFPQTNMNFGILQDHNGATNDNYFLQFAKVDSSCSKEEAKDIPKALSKSNKSFVFGQKMDERVAGAQLKEKEAASGTAPSVELSPTASVTTDASDKESPGKAQESGKSLLENANAYEKAKKSSGMTFEKVPSKTGEEDEENVFQAQCKLYVFDAENQSWQERGRGLLRLNDLVRASSVRSSSEQTSLRSRLVMRTQGSLRVVLNTKIWSGMTIEKASPKNIRLSARGGESDSIRVFLVSASPKDAEQIYRAIEYRVQELKYAEQQAEKAKEMEREETKDVTSGGEEEEEDKEDVTKETKTASGVTTPVGTADSDDSVSQTNSALTDRSTPDPADPRIEGDPKTPPADE